MSGTLSRLWAGWGIPTVSASLRYQAIVSGRDAAVAEALSKLAKPDEPEMPES